MAEGRTDAGSGGGCQAWLRGPSAAIYAAYFLSSWGDRMWHFGVGIYLVFFDGNELRLAAVYGFISSGCIMLFGGIIGNWVDRNKRMTAVRVSLFTQNLSVALSATGVAVLLAIPAPGHAAYVTLQLFVVILAVVAVMASCAYKIAIEKDWIVIVASGDSSQLANLNAVTRSVDLLCKAISPLIVGQVMTYGSRLAGAVFMAAWNIFSVVLEYLLLCRVYKLVPRLATKEAVPNQGEDTEKPEEETKELTDKVVVNGSNPDCPDQNEAESENQTLQKAEHEPEVQSETRGGTLRCLRQIFTPCIQLVTGWSVYMRQHVLLAGLSLACLYMTVLGFDSITIGYIYSQGVTESILGICCGLSAVTGIIGTFLYTRFHRCLGLRPTGIISFSTQVSFLLFSLVSIWTPGSPFYLYHSAAVDCPQSPVSAPAANTTLVTTIVSLPPIPLNESRARRHAVLYGGYQAGQSQNNLFLPSLVSKDLQEVPWGQVAIDTAHSRSVRDVSYKSEVFLNATTPPDPCKPSSHSQTSVILFLTGIIASRIGLWMVDLTVTQIYQEQVAEKERGVVGGVQSSLNMFLDMLKFVAVILMPEIRTFGFLVIMSFLFICLGLISFTAYVLRATTCRKDTTSDNQNHPHTNQIYKPRQNAAKV